MFTNRATERSSASWSATQVGAGIILSVLTLTSAHAGNIIGLSCVGTLPAIITLSNAEPGATGFNCVAQWATAGDPYVRVVPEALGEVQKGQLMARDRKWSAQCHPVIERDRYGVARYHYSAPGCEFGLGTE